MTYDEMKREYKFTLKNYPAVSNLFESKNIICTTTREIKIRAYTKFGYVPVRLISTSPDGTERTIREFTF